MQSNRNEHRASRGNMVHTDVEPGKPRCPRCTSGHVDGVKEDGKIWLICMDCGWDEFEEKNTKP